MISSSGSQLARLVTRIGLLVVFAGSMSSVVVSGSPIPLPMPLRMAPDYSPRLIPVNQTVPYRRHAVFDLAPRAGIPEHRPVDLAERATHSLAKLRKYYSVARNYGERFRKLGDKPESDADFQNDYVEQLNGFSVAMSDYTAALAKATSDKGLANYDKDNDLETLLKNTVNLNKDVLSAATKFVYDVPALGPILGPIVYSLKCTVDDILNIVEDYSDGLLNTLQPLLQSLFPSAVTSNCPTGIELLGLCL